MNLLVRTNYWIYFCIVLHKNWKKLLIRTVLLVLGRRTGTHREDGCVYKWCIFSLSICTSVTWSNHSEINFRINSNQNNLGVGEILWCNRISAETCVLTRTHITLYLFQRKKILQYLFQQKKNTLFIQKEK